MVGDTNSGIQVLNISNVNAAGTTVLNDGKLLELIQKYPFLYNPRVKTYNDSDYSLWAWKNINAAFNRSYANDPNAAFSTADLMRRWNFLKPLIQCLSKAYDLEAIPQALRRSVVKISTELENQSVSEVSILNKYQHLLLQNMRHIDELPMEKKLALEREILDVILSAELESTQAAKLDDVAWNQVHSYTDEVLNAIGYQQIVMTSIDRRQGSFSNEFYNQSMKRYKKSKKSLGWVPRKDIFKYIKPCEVRLQRINVEDYLPLAQIKAMQRKRSICIKTENFHTESSGIFGI